MLKIKRLLPLLFSLVLLFCSVLPVQAQTVSSGDALYANEFVSPQMMSLSPVSTLSTEDYGIATVNSVFLYSVADGSKSVTYRPSYYTGVDILSFELFDFFLPQESGYKGKDVVTFCFTGGLTISGITNGMNYLGYTLWVIADGVRYDLANLGEWYSFTSNHYFVSDIINVGIDIHFAPVYDTGSSSMDIKPNGTGGYSVYEYYTDRALGGNITVSWLGCEFDLIDSNTSDAYWGSKNNADMNSGMTNIFNRLEDVRISLWNQIEALRVSLWSKIDEFRIQTFDNFAALFERMDDDQEELINGYDPGTGSAAKNEFDSSVAELEAAESNLFGQTSYDQVDYKQFNSFFSIEAVAASMLFVKSILEALFSALGVFGVPISIGLVLLVFTRIIGFQNFYSGGE